MYFVCHYFCVKATRNPFYLYVGSDILESLEKYARDKLVQ